MSCIAVVIIPLVSLLEEAMQGARDAGLKTFHATELVKLSYSEMRSEMSQGCAVFVSMEAVESAAIICSVAHEVGGLLVVDEEHMVHTDMHFRPSFRSFWEIGARFGLKMPTLLLSATLRPCMETEVNYDLGLEEVKTFSVIRSPMDQQRQVRIQWITSKQQGIAWLQVHGPDITFVMSKIEAETLAAELGILFIHSELEPEERKRRIERVKQGARCVATSVVAVGVNLNPKKVALLGHTYVHNHVLHLTFYSIIYCSLSDTAWSFCSKCWVDCEIRMVR
jgi:superfamily II DNA helicase RecQ